MLLGHAMPWLCPSEVEICAGKGELSQALRDCGLATKSFDVAWKIFCGFIGIYCHNLYNSHNLF